MLIFFSVSFQLSSSSEPMGNKLGAPPGGGGGGGTGTGNGTPEGAGTSAEGAGKDTSHSTHSRLLRPGGPASTATAVVNGVMSEPTVAGGGSSGDPEAEGLADVPPPMMPIKASIPLSATATSVAAAVDENVSHYSIAYR